MAFEIPIKEYPAEKFPAILYIKLGIVGMLIDEGLTRRHIGTHKHCGNIGRHTAVLDLDAAHHTCFRIQRCLPKLIRIHLSESLVALQGKVSGMRLTILVKSHIVIQILFLAF